MVVFVSDIHHTTIDVTANKNGTYTVDTDGVKTVLDKEVLKQMIQMGKYHKNPMPAYTGGKRRRTKRVRKSYRKKSYRRRTNRRR